MRKNQQLVIVLPESSEELPIRIVRGSRSMELRLCLCPPDGEERHINETCPERKYVFIWRQNDYLKTAGSASWHSHDIEQPGDAYPRAVLRI